MLNVTSVSVVLVYAAIVIIVTFGLKGEWLRKFAVLFCSLALAIGAFLASIS